MDRQSNTLPTAFIKALPFFYFESTLCLHSAKNNLAGGNSNIFGMFPSEKKMIQFDGHIFQVETTN